jgi:hypothetical protein
MRWTPQRDRFSGPRKWMCIRSRASPARRRSIAIVSTCQRPHSRRRPAPIRSTNAARSAAASRRSTPPPAPSAGGRTWSPSRRSEARARPDASCGDRLAPASGTRRPSTKSAAPSTSRPATPTAARSCRRATRSSHSTCAPARFDGPGRSRRRTSTSPAAAPAIRIAPRTRGPISTSATPRCSRDGQTARI